MARILRITGALTAFSLVAAVALSLDSGTSYANHLQCSDGIDNDFDGAIDFPQDSDCADGADATEGVLSVQATSSASSSSASSTSGISIAVTDDRTTIQPGNSVIYAITVLQNLQAQRNVDVDLYLPTFANIISPDQGGAVSNNRVRWSGVSLIQGQPLRLTASVGISPTTPQGTVFAARAVAADAEATDSTTVQAGISSAAQGFQVSVSDGRQTASPNEELSYSIGIVNTSNSAHTSDVKLVVSPYIDVTQIDPSAPYTSTTITWEDVEFQPGQPRIFTFRGKVRRGAPEFASISTQVTVGSATASDVTTVQTPSATRSASSSSLSSSHASARNQNTSSAVQRSVLFSKTADAREVVPGGTIRYTLYVQNVLLNTIDDASISDRFDPSLLSVEDAGGATVAGPGQLQWKVPRLMPGQIWQQTYTLKAQSTLGNGAELRNIASIIGDDVAYAALNEKVTVVKTGVVQTLPSTGAAFDLLFVLSSLPLAFASAKIHRKVAR